MVNFNKFVGFILLIMIIGGCFLEVEAPYTKIAPGYWRGILQVEKKFITPNPKGEPLPEKLNIEFEEVTAGELPFVFEVIYRNETDFHIEIINGDERIKLDDIHFGRDKSTAKDTIIINFPIYESYIKAICEENIMQGHWIATNRKNYAIPFIARFGKKYRFTQLKKPPIMDISGLWETTFEPGTANAYKAIAEFQQNGNHLSGTFKTETGDYRYLEGSIQDDKAYLSCFDGSHAFLFEAKIKKDSTLIGSFRSGKHYKTIWNAYRNPDFRLQNPDSLTYLKEGYSKFDFSIKNTSGQMVSLQDDAFKNKVKLVQILGTWCPNCKDETIFLNNYLKQNKEKDIAIIGLAFEKHTENDKAKAAIQRYMDKLKLEYDILPAGYANKAAAGEVLPMLNHIMSYPTLLIIDKNDQIRKIHTGFSGPATSDYTTFTHNFDLFVNKLLDEPLK